MSVLLDSHALLWALHDPGRLRPEAAAIIRDPGRTVHFSAASVWEIELKAALGKLDLPDGWIETARAIGFVELPVHSAEARASARLPWHHKDPFDRLLVAQALGQGLRIATRDTWIAAYEVAVMPV